MWFKWILVGRVATAVLFFTMYLGKGEKNEKKKEQR